MDLLISTLLIKVLKHVCLVKMSNECLYFPQNQIKIVKVNLLLQKFDISY